MSKEVIAVFTARNKERIISEGGSQAWALNAQNAQRCRFLVCTRNRYTYPAEAGPEEHGAAFLVGKITSIDTAPERSDRFIIRFDEYALLDPQPVVWPGARNPVWYLDKLADLNIDENSLMWQHVPSPDEAETPPANTLSTRNDLRGNATRAAREFIARAYDVSPESVTITINV